MPFESKAQMKYLYATHPQVAEEFASHTKDFKDLPKKKKAKAKKPRPSGMGMFGATKK